MYLLGKWRHATFPLVQAKIYSNITISLYSFLRITIDPFFFSFY